MAIVVSHKMNILNGRKLVSHTQYNLHLAENTIGTKWHIVCRFIPMRQRNIRFISKQ